MGSSSFPSKLASAWIVSVVALSLAINLMLVGLELQTVIEAKFAGSRHAGQIHAFLDTARNLMGHSR